jgi:hypothetical protein
VHPFLSPERWKPVSAPLVAQSDLVVINRPAAEQRPPSPAVMEAVAAHRGGNDVVVADVTQPLAQWAPALAARLATLP